LSNKRITDEAALKLFKSRMREAEDVSRGYENKWLRLDKVYHGQESNDAKKSDDPHRSRLRIPWAWQQIETIIPRIMDPEPKFDFRPVEPSDEKMGKILEVLVRQQLNEDRFVSKQRSFIESAAVKGLAVAKVVWLQEEREAYVRQPQNALARALKKAPATKEKKIVTNRPTIRVVPVEDFRWDVRGSRDDELAWAADGTWLTKAELKDRQKRGIYKDVELIEDSDDASGRRGEGESAKEAEARRQGKYRVWEMHDRQGNVITVCGNVLLRNVESPYYHLDIPYATFSTQPNPHSLVGVSEVEKIEHLQHAVWTIDNQRRDAISLALNPVFLVDPTIKGVRNLTFRPGLKIYANRGQRFDQLHIDPNASPGWQESEAYVGGMQHMTGANPMMFGNDFGVNQETATGASIMQEEGNKRMAMKKLSFRLFESRIAKLMVQLNHQYISQLEVSRIVGEVGLEYEAPTPDMIPMFLDVIPQAMNENLSKSVERNTLLEAMQTLGPIQMMPMGNGTVLDIHKVIERLVRTYDIDPADVFIPQEYAQQPVMPGIPEGGSPMDPSIADQTSEINEVL
jgi:hypothetical protein